MVTPIDIINAARKFAGHRALRLRYGTTHFLLVQSLYHATRREALCAFCPEFAIKEMPTEGKPIDLLRDLGNGMYVCDHEPVWEWSDDFKTKMVELLAQVL